MEAPASSRNRFLALPKTVYKYRQVDEHALRLLTHGSIYFASARDFNDPFDTTTGYDFEADEETKFWWVNRFLKRHHPELDKKARRRKARETLADVEAAGPGRPFLAQQLLEQQRFEQHGIFCAAGVRDDLLMWAHYAASHTGICVGLHRGTLMKLALLERLKGRYVEAYNVRYQDELDRPSFFSTPKAEDWPEWHGRVIATKSTHWSYEQEVRLVSWNGSGVILDGGAALVSEVVLGCRISKDDEAKVLSALLRAGSAAVVYRARRHDRRFELVLDPVETAPPPSA